MVKEYNEGVQAYFNKVCVKDNPYVAYEQPSEWCDWMRGWLDTEYFHSIDKESEDG